MLEHVLRKSLIVIHGSDVFHSFKVFGLRPSIIFTYTIYVGRFPWVERILSHEDHDVVCLKTQNCAVGEIRTYNILVESPTFFQLSYYASSLILGICM